MIIRFLFFVLIAAIPFNGFSQARTPPRQHKPYFMLLESYTQRILPGRREGRPVTNTHFIIVWQGNKFPQAFVWKDTTGFFTCNITKAHKIVGNGRNTPQGMDYYTENIAVEKISKGDTLELTPVAAGKPAIVGMPQKTENTLFFKTNGSGWLSSPVKNMTRKRDIAMP